MPDPNIGMMVATTIANYSGKLADNVTNHNPLLQKMKESGNITFASGGTKIRQELEYGENSTAKWYSGLEELDTTVSDVVDAADFDWKQLSVNVIVSGLDEVKNSGKEAIHDFVKTKVKNAEKTAHNKVATALFSDGTGSGGKELTGLQAIVSDTATNNVGSIDRSVTANAFWKNQIYDFSTEASGNASATNILTGMNTLWRRCTRGVDVPKIVVMDDLYMGFYETATQDIQRIQSTSRGALGFEEYIYKGKPVVYDSSCPASHLYMLNTDFLYFRPKRSRNFTMGAEKHSINQDAKVIPLYWAGNLTCSNASLQGVAKN